MEAVTERLTQGAFSMELSDDQREKCINEDPPLMDRGNGHDTACHYAEALRLL